jgi:glycogen(starch) synthase
MRIIIWTDGFWPEIGGLEVFCMRLVTALQRRGHACLVVSNSPPGLAARHDPYEQIPVHRFTFQDALTRGDLKLFHREQEACARVVEEFDPQVIHVNAMYRSILGFVVMQRNRRRPAVLTLHDSHLYRRHDTLREAVMENIDLVAAVSNSIRRDALAQVPGIAGKLHLVSNALPALRIPPAPLPRGHRLLAFGRLVRDKGFDLAIEAFAEIARQFPEATLTVAGDGEERSRLEAQAGKAGLGLRVHFPGWIDPDDAPALINRHSLVIMPSRWQEPFGLVALQAAQMGRPIVASRVGGIPEIVLDGVTGKLFANENVAELTQAIRELLEDPALAEKMGRQAQAHVQEHFNFDRFVDGYESLYARAFGNQPAA